MPSTVPSLQTQELKRWRRQYGQALSPQELEFLGGVLSGTRTALRAIVSLERP